MRKVISLQQAVVKNDVESLLEQLNIQFPDVNTECPYSLQDITSLRLKDVHFELHMAHADKLLLRVFFGPSAFQALTTPNLGQRSHLSLTEAKHICSLPKGSSDSLSLDELPLVNPQNALLLLSVIKDGNGEFKFVRSTVFETFCALGADSALLRGYIAETKMLKRITNILTAPLLLTSPFLFLFTRMGVKLIAASVEHLEKCEAQSPCQPGCDPVNAAALRTGGLFLAVATPVLGIAVGRTLYRNYTSHIATQNGLRALAESLVGNPVTRQDLLPKETALPVADDLPDTDH